MTYDDDTKGTEAEAIIRAIERLAEGEALDLATDRAIVLPEGKRVESLKPILDSYRTAPERMTGAHVATTLDSFVRLTMRHADEGSAVFLDDRDPNAPRLRAILDFHDPGRTSPRFGDHSITYAFPVSPEWQRWVKASNGEMDQRSFAEFLQDRAIDIVDPGTVGPATAERTADLGIAPIAGRSRVLELARGIAIRADVKVASATNLATGESEFAFMEEHTDAKTGGALRIPGGFVIGIPVFRLGARYQIPVRLRYRLRSGAVAWSVTLAEAEAAYRDALAEAADTVGKATGLPVFYGAP